MLHAPDGVVQAQELGAHRRLLPVDSLPLVVPDRTVWQSAAGGGAGTAPAQVVLPEAVPDIEAAGPDAMAVHVVPGVARGEEGMDSVLPAIVRDDDALQAGTPIDALSSPTAADLVAREDMRQAAAPVVSDMPQETSGEPGMEPAELAEHAGTGINEAPQARGADEDEPPVAVLPPPIPPAPASLAELFKVRQETLAQHEGAQVPSGPLPLEELVGMAVDWHPAINQELGRILQEGEQIRVAKAGYLPQIQGGVSTQFNSNTDSGSTRRHVQMLNFSVSQMLYDFGKVSASVGIAQAGELVAQAGLLSMVDEVARDTAGSVVEALRYAQLLRVAREQVDGVSAIANLARRRNELGASNQSDTVQAQARLSAARATVLSMETERARWLSNLQSLTGLREPPEMDEELPLALGRSCMTAKPQWDNIPAMLEARAERMRAQSEQEQARANGLPTLSIKGQSSKALNSMPSSYTGDGVTVALEVSAPIYQGGATVAQRRAASYATGAADAAMEKVRVKTERSLYETVTRALSGNEREDILLERERSTRQTRDLYRKQYLDLGTRSLLDLLNAEQELHQARMETINHRFDTSLLQLDCLQLSGGLRRFMGLGGGRSMNWEAVDDGH